MYRIYTEDRNRERITGILDSYFPAYTVIPAIGRWQGKAENSLVIEVSTDDRNKVIDAAARIKADNAQEAVMITQAAEEVTIQ